jgi:hypothetical protein
MATGTDVPRRTRTSRALAHRARAGAERTTWRRWFTATTLGELVGFLIPVGVVSAGADELAGPLRFLLVVLAGAGEGAVLGWAQSRVLRPLLPGLSTRAWTARTAAAAALAWTIGMGPSTLGAVFDGWAPAGWLAGLAVFLGVAPPLWHAGQGVLQVALVGVLAGVGMAFTMAAVTGWGLVRLLRGAPSPRCFSG